MVCQIETGREEKCCRYYSIEKDKSSVQGKDDREKKRKKKKKKTVKEKESEGSPKAPKAPQGTQNKPPHSAFPIILSY